MNITIRRPFLDQLKGQGFKNIDEHLRYNDWNSGASLKIDVGVLTEPELKKILAVIKKDPKANSNSLNTIELWKKAQENPKDQKPRTLEHFSTILKEYIATFPKYQFYVQNDNGDWTAYVAVNVGYKPPRKTRDGVEPAYAWLKGAYYCRGSIHNQTWHFTANDVKGNTCSHILSEEGIITASGELDARYEVEVARYKQLRGSYGTQVWGEGYAESATSRGWRGSNSFSLDIDGRRSRLVIDDHVEGSDKRESEATTGEAPVLDGSFWKTKGREADEDDEGEIAEAAAPVVLEVPIVPEVLVFNLEKHEQAWAHVNRLTDYTYDEALGSKLVLPDYQKELIAILVDRNRAELTDIISGKAGGSIVLCSGEPGTGKTLTAEVFAETIKRPLYVVASSQLGTSPEELETELKLVLDRATRLGAIMLIDESDVFIHTRGEDMVQNAVVGVFLRLLEYYQGIMFLTTNRATIVDDAIISRCTAQVKFEIPTPEGQKRIWRILADLSGIKLSDGEIDKFVKRHEQLSGRDVKGVLKLANMIAVRRKESVTAKLLEYVMQFKPTHESVVAERGAKK